ncbi:hypothetical protein [Acidithiobacillus ferriphilus]|uniref:hypothetical protein n=1 Tax=Acidithiobacillus ferriphilus TaxID=1689834 RepID=UPI001C0724B9|nr:hypothetical protein [Acidithiobacillus ferriphilus]
MKALGDFYDLRAVRGRTAVAHTPFPLGSGHQLMQDTAFGGGMPPVAASAQLLKLPRQRL